MKTQSKDRVAENRKYRQAIAKRGLMITGFLMPRAIRADVANYVKVRSLQYALTKKA